MKDAKGAFVGTTESDATFHLGAPALVCRWRMAGKHVPMLNRHLRALAQRQVNGAPLTTNLLSWAKQHIEWSLAEDAYAETDGVLMIVIDEEGQAAMTVGAFEPLADASLEALSARARQACHEAAVTGVAPETLCAVHAGTVRVAEPAASHPSGVLTLVEQLARTKGLAVEVASLSEEDDPAGLAAGPGAVFLVSDEFGVVPAQGAEQPADPEDAAFVELLVAGYEKLRDAAR